MNSLLPDSAFWIGSAHPFDLQEAYLCFRRTWAVSSLPKRAELSITADSRYKLWVNGHPCACGPARSYPHMQCVDRLDVTQDMQMGLNCLAVQVYVPGYSHMSYVHRGAAGMLANLISDDEHTFSTDSLWKVRRDPSFALLVPRVSIYSSGVESRDLSLAEEWTSEVYDDSSWNPARIVAPVGGYPWTNLEPRTLPLLEEREIAITLLETRLGPNALDSDGDTHHALKRGWQSAQHQAMRADNSGWFTPRAANGESAYWLFDLGRDFVCQGWAEITGAGGQERMAVSYAEKIRDGQVVVSDPQDYCRMRMTDDYRLRAGNQTAESFALRGGRYLLFQMTGPTGPSLAIRFHARAAEYPLAISRELRTTDGKLAKIIALCEDTCRACLLDGFVDSTWRESSQWLGDALPQALVMLSMSDDTRPLRRVIEMAAQGAYPDGILPSVLPSEAHAYTVVDYNFTWVELLSHYWKVTGDHAFVHEMWDMLVRMLDRFHRDLTLDGLIVSQPGRRLFLDWAPNSRNEPNAIYNLHYLLALNVASQLAEKSAVQRDRTVWVERADRLKAAIRDVFWRHGKWYDDAARTTYSQLAASLALITNAARPDEAEELLQAIAARSLDADDAFDPNKMVLASPFMHHYVFEALRCGGKSRQVIEIICRRWGRWVDAGYPTTWENWNVDFPDGSQCHAFSAHPRYHLAEIARSASGPDLNLLERSIGL